MKTKIAIIGLGKMGLLHTSILHTMPNVEIAAFCDKSSMLLKIAKRLLKNAKTVDDVAKLRDLDLDTAYVTTPIPSHFGIIKDLLSNQIVKNIFVEKTLTSSWNMSRDLCQLVRNFDGVNQVGFMKRFSVTFEKAKSMLTQKVLGKPFSFNAYAYSSDFSKVQHGSKKSTLRGGVLRDLGSHVIDLAIWFFGNFEVASASLESIVAESSEDAVNFSISNSTLKGEFQISWCAEKHRMPSFGVSVTGDKGKLRVDDYSLNLSLNNGTKASWFKHDLGDSVNFLLGDPEYYREDDKFIKSVLGGRSTEPSFETASKTDYIIDQVKREATIVGR